MAGQHIDNRTVDQKIAAVRASMDMAGYSLRPVDEQRMRAMARGEMTGDEAVLETLEEFGLEDSERAKFLRRRIAEAGEVQ